MLTLIYFILILGLIVLVHEIGHFLFAKLFKVYVYEFSIGMGPKLFTRKDKNKETEYSIRAIPIGGFVSLAGEEVDDDKKIPKNRKVYGKPIWQRFLIMFAGAGMNFILAFFMLFFAGLIWGAPSMDPVISEVKANYPMYNEGIRDNDKILAIDGNKTKTIDDVMLYLTLAEEGNEVTFKIEDTTGNKKEYKVTPIKEKEDGKDVYRYGVSFENSSKSGFVESIKYAFIKMGAVIRQMIIVLKYLFTGRLGISTLSGPVGIYSVVGSVSSSGFFAVFQLIALLSINVGFINLIPFPAFDGGRLLFLVIEKIKGSPVKPEIENKIHSIGFMLLMGLIIYITFNDILKLFG